MSDIKEQYLKTVVPALKEEFGFKNIHAVPKMEKVTLNIGLGKSISDSRYLEVAEKTLERITGQKPVATKARKSISNFKVREGMIVGMKVTLRGPRMYDFVDKLVNVTFPRVRDFRGISEKSVDRAGNFSYGFREHVAFPEIHPDEVELLHGLEVNITTTATSREEGLALFKKLGFPFKKSKK